MRRVRLLLSARDAGAVAQVAALAAALRDDPRLETTLVASPPAFDLLAAAGELPVRFALPDGSTHVQAGGDPAPLLEAAQRMLATLDPDVVVTGISSLGVGIDEALLARAGGRPTFALQDFPGDANAIDGGLAERYFVRDEAAARLTRERWGVEATPVGSLRHACYAALDVPALRASVRQRLGAPRGRSVVGFFGQPAEIPGDEAAFRDLVGALTERPAKPLCVLREHPKSLGRREAHLAALRSAGVEIFDASEMSAAEPWLVACDLVTTCFSHCSMDYAFLSSLSPDPLGAVLFLMTTPESRAFLSEYAGLAVPDGVEQGLGLVARDPAEVLPLMDALLTPGGRREYHEASLLLPRGADIQVIVDSVLEAGHRHAGEAQS